MFNLKIIIIIVLIIILLIALYYSFFNSNKNQSGAVYKLYNMADYDQYNDIPNYKEYDAIYKDDDVFVITLPFYKYNELIKKELATISNPGYDITNFGNNDENINIDPIKFILQKYANQNKRIVFNWNIRSHDNYEVIKTGDKIFDANELKDKIKRCYKIIQDNGFCVFIVHYNALTNDINIYLFEHEQFNEIKDRLLKIYAKLEKERNDTRQNTLNREAMKVITKYFMTIEDFINIEKTSKECNGFVEEYVYNPIPFTKPKEYQIFRNIETYHKYGDPNELKNPPVNAKPVKHKIVWNATNILTLSDQDKNDFNNGKCTYKQLYYKDDANDKDLNELIIPKGTNTLINHNFENYMMSTVNIPTSISTIGNSCFIECKNLREIDIPPSVISIGDNCFAYCGKLSTVNIPPSVTKIGNNCFSNCSSLTSIGIPPSITKIGSNCFSNCSKLVFINIPTSIISIGASCFEGCDRLSSIVLPSSIESIGSDCFRYCNLLSINLPTNISSIGESCFEGCENLREIIISPSVINIPDYCFSNCSSLTSIKIPTSITSIGNGCFEGCENLRQIVIPPTVTSISNGCFEGCSSLTSIVIPPTVTSIGDRCFEGCKNLRQIIIPVSVTSIGDRCFNHCSNLTNIVIDDNNPVYKTDGTDIYRKNTNEKLIKDDE